LEIKIELSLMGTAQKRSEKVGKLKYDLRGRLAMFTHKEKKGLPLAVWSKKVPKGVG